jgi:hypothetical protein
VVAITAQKVRRVLFECDAREFFNKGTTRRERAEMRLLLSDLASGFGLDEDDAVTQAMEQEPFEHARWPLAVLVAFLLEAVPRMQLLETFEDVDSRE